MKALLKVLPFSLPESYVNFMNYYDGGEESIGEYGYLAIFGVDEILAMNVGDDAYGRFKK